MERLLIIQTDVVIVEDFYWLLVVVVVRKEGRGRARVVTADPVVTLAKVGVAVAVFLQ